jgi:iron complex outermembrane recepter protein
MKKLWVCSASMLMTAAGTLPAYAQTDEGVQLEEIVVTAEKREENLQKVAVSIQVKNGDDLRKQGKKRIDEIMEGTVGIQASGSPTGTSFYIRGVEPAAAGRGTPVTTPIIIDGVAQNRTESVRGGTLDVAQVEVMRGPQSTALGANSLSGAISLVSNKPVFEYVGNGSLEYGNFNKVSTEGVLNVPLSDNQALRIAYANDKRDGYYSNGSGETDTVNARIKYRVKASDDLDVTASLSHQKIGGAGSELGVRASGTWVPYTSSLGGTTDGCNMTTLPTGYSAYIGCPTTFVLKDDGSTFRTRSNAWDDGMPKNGWGWGAYQDSTIDQANVEINWNTGIGTVVIQPSYQRSHFKSLEGSMGLSGPSTAGEDIRENTSTLDARINSNSDSVIKWQAGARYNVDDYGHNNLFEVVTAPGTADPMGGYSCEPTPLANCYTWSVTPAQQAKGLSGYANGEYSIIDTLRVIGGIRYNHDSASVDQANGFLAGTSTGVDPAALAAATVYHGSQTWNKVTYRAGLEWDVLPETMLYTTVSTGYTPGTVGGMSFDNNGNYVSSDAVTLKQISAGWKSQFLDNRLQFNGEFFATKFYNRTVSVASTSTNALADSSATAGCSNTQGATNYGGFYVIADSNSTGSYCVVAANTVTAPTILSKGLDMDLTWLISAEDRLTTTFEWLDTTYDQRARINGVDSGSQTSLKTAIGNAATSAGVTLSDAQLTQFANFYDYGLSSLVGLQLQNAPKYSATLAYQHEFDLTKGGTLTPRIEAAYKYTYWSTGENPFGNQVAAIVADKSSLYWQPSYLKWDAYTTWTNADGKFTATGYIKNVTNKVIMTAYDGSVVQLAAPRTFGVTLSANF